jgi:catechol 2,3-dioxygenase-like lactoylglutathione lyase family enzyme
MQIVNNLTMFSMSVSDMPKAKAFYADKLGLAITADYRQNDDDWWVTFTPAGGGPNITLARAKDHVPASVEGLKPGTLSLYFATSDIAASHKELAGKGVKVNDIQDDLYGPGSGVKWFNLEDPDGNTVHVVQA